MIELPAPPAKNEVDLAAWIEVALGCSTHANLQDHWF